MSEVDTMLGLTSGYAANYEATGFSQDVANSTANKAMSQAAAAVAAAGGNVSKSQAEAIANATDDPVAAMIEITKNANYNQNSGSSGFSGMTPGNAVTDSSGQAVRTVNGGYVTSS